MGSQILARATWPVLIVASYFLASSPIAAGAQTYTGPVATAMGGAGRAAVDPNEAIYLNPAAVSYLDRLYGAVHYLRGDLSDGTLDDQTVGAHFADGSSDMLFPGGLSYQRRSLKGLDSPRLVQQDFRAAIAGKPFENVSLGFAGQHTMSEYKYGPRYKETNADLGLLYTPFNWLGFAFVATSLLQPDDSIPIQIRSVPTLAAGILGNYQGLFSARLDVVQPQRENPRRRSDLHLGIESVLAGSWKLRAGYTWKETRDQGLFGAGFGYFGPRLSFNYAYENGTRGPESTRHLIDLWIPF